MCGRVAVDDYANDSQEEGFCLESVNGTDPTLKGKLHQKEINRRATDFGDKIPINMFTPCELQGFRSFHVSWRGYMTVQQQQQQQQQ